MKEKFITIDQPADPGHSLCRKCSAYDTCEWRDMYDEVTICSFKPEPPRSHRRATRVPADTDIGAFYSEQGKPQEGGRDE